MRGKHKNVKKKENYGGKLSRKALAKRGSFRYQFGAAGTAKKAGSGILNS